MQQLEDKLQSESFEQSDFVGNGWYVSCLRWYRQFLALNEKNIRIYARRKIYLCVSLILPALAVLIFFLSDSAVNSGSANETSTQTPTELKGLGSCDAFFANDGCIQVAFAPSTPWTRDVMQSVSSYNDLDYGEEVLDFPTINALKTYVASNLGKVQFSVFFYENQSLWYTSDSYCYDPYKPNCNTVPKNINETMSYSIFYNLTHGSIDNRSKYHNVNFPLLVLQKSIEEFILRAMPGYTNVTYDASFAQTWSYNPKTFVDVEAMTPTNTTCGEISKDMFNVNLASPLVFTYAFQLMGILAFQVITEERHKGLLRSLRTLGLNHSSYWVTWLLLFQILAILGSIVGLILAAIVRPHVYILEHLDFGVLFLFLWMSISCSIGNAMFLSSFIPAGNWSSVVTFLNFFGAFLTLIFLSFKLNSYQYFLYVREDESQYTLCQLAPSDYSAAYDHRKASGLLQFVVFWLPWFHIGKVLNDIYSIIQYGDDFTFSMLNKSYTMYYLKDFTPIVSSFQPPTTGWTLGIMMLNTIIYVILAWLLGQLAEGIPLEVILIPAPIRKYLLGLNNPVFANDYRGIERQRSSEEDSIRAYKISKTYDKIQALREVSFDIQKGEVFCLLGHNGAGKSTLFNILSGNTPTTHGNVYILGHDCNFEMKDIQQIIGICPQSDYLWDELTALEHMRIYARFKGLRVGPKLDAACCNVLSIVGLLDRKDTLAKNFSGGMKRRLSAAMSVIGQVKVLYLDEPTTGLDPLSRRAIWDMVSIMKKDRVVVLTTHNLEEADYLADRIMILQNGQVKALGTSLALKQTYGTGYQVRMIVDPRLAQPISTEIIKFLPRSTFGGDTTAGNIIVRISQMDYLFFGRFLQWLELIQQRYSSMNEVIKEWGISNTTLEQVFLVLCESSQTNYSGSSMLDNGDNICPLCETNPKESISFLQHTEELQLMLPRAICKDCEAIPYFLVRKEEVSPLFQLENEDQRRVIISNMFTNAQNNRYQQMNKLSAAQNLDDEFRQAILNSQGSEHVANNITMISDELIGAAGMIIVDEKQISNSNTSSNNTPTQRLQGGHLRMGKVNDVVSALSVKNFQLQSYQRYSTCCALFTMTMFILSVVVIGLLWASAATCPQGNTVDALDGQSCSIDYQSDYLFSAQDSAGWSFAYMKETVLNTSMLVYLTPRLWSNTYLYINSDANSPTHGLPMYVDRIGTIWAGHINSSVHDYQYEKSMFFPKGWANESHQWNAEMFEFQKENFDAVNSEPNHCLYSPSSFVNSTFSYVTRVAFAEKFADAIFDCPTCQFGQSKFAGNLWVSSIGTSDYPYVFINTPANSWYSVPQNSCPLFAAITPLATYYDLTNPSYRSDAYYMVNNTVQAMQFINTLSNSIYDPTGKNVAIEAAVSYYSFVSYDHGASQFLVFLLSMLFVLLMNGVFPMSVWRLSYEKISQLRLMMNSIGLKDPLYALGMYMFDFTIMFIINVVASIVLVQARLSYFANVPLGYMIALSFLSAYCLSAFAFCFVRFAPTTSRITTLIATLLTYVGSISASLICIINYPDVGTWPNGLSIIPFFAQVRVLWVLLTLGKATDEVSFALGMLFLFGTVCIIIEYIGASRELLWHWLRETLFLKLLANRANCESKIVIPATDEENLLIQAAGGEDSDVLKEKHDMMKLSADKYADYAIVMKNLRREFILEDHRKAPLVAVDNLSLGLKFGEVFGLLGPNGAGKSTTLSILCGILQPTSGELYVAGQNILDIRSAAFHSFIGICPQSDICWEDLTVEQHLGFQARLRGVESNRVSSEVQRVAVKIGLDGDSFKTSAGKLSGGQRRRLSIGMSIVADPPIIFLDEPSAGLDPNTRKGLWQLIASLKEPHRCIVLTTHSMEEAETLCSRLGVISEGKLRCLGTGLHLKRKFGTGYTIELSVSSNSSDMSQDNSSSYADVATRIDDFMFREVALQQAMSPGNMLLSAINLTRKYIIPRHESLIKISDIFVKMESNKKQLGISQWSISETTLEDIFISLVLKSRALRNNNDNMNNKQDHDDEDNDNNKNHIWKPIPMEVESHP